MLERKGPPPAAKRHQAEEINKRLEVLKKVKEEKNRAKRYLQNEEEGKRVIDSDPSDIDADYDGKDEISADNVMGEKEKREIYAEMDDFDRRDRGEIDSMA